MVFSSVAFLFMFLPLCLLLYFLTPQTRRSTARNTVLLVFSVFFYFWGEIWNTGILLSSVIVNFVSALLIDRSNTQRHRKMIITLNVAFNLGLLGFYKYSGWLIENAWDVLKLFGISNSSIPSLNVLLPLGISFYTFQAMSYTIDVYRGKVKVTKSLIDFACYITMFPQLVAGPIVCYRDISDKMASRRGSLEEFSQGIGRFVIGLAKKLLVANTMAEVADIAFALPPSELGGLGAWVGAIGYTLQIYFDFSAYSDMAIGMGHMFGFTFLENFRHPYTANSIRDYWRRWHISLSTWLRDYLYIPLGGSRKGALRTYVNLFIVFLLCGLWHGASWNFVTWGAYYGCFLILERLGLDTLLMKCPRMLRHLYVLLVIILGWVIFRAETLAYAWEMLRMMFTDLSFSNEMHQVLNPYVYLWAIIGVTGASGLGVRVYNQLHDFFAKKDSMAFRTAWESGLLLYGSLCVILSLISLVSGMHNPFIYFRF